MSVHYLQHVSYEKPGSIKNWAQERNWTQNRSLVPDGDSLPDPEDGDLVVVLGGPMSVYEEDKHPWLGREKFFLRDCLNSDVKVLGLCLGAQLIADVLGADVYPMDGEEKGWHPISWNEHAQNLDMTDDLPHQHQVFHWHGDTFDIPDNGVHLARSNRCDNQAFLVPGTALGLQFHLEMTEGIIRALLARSAGDSTGPSHPDPVPPSNGPDHDQLHQYMAHLLNVFALTGSEPQTDT